ncbi:MAG TPA: hypothetical protein VHF25_12040 [Nitriliruptorales bacterium]|nr:hypothetical protein [Nitriliruptorales bacterium]
MSAVALFVVVAVPVASLALLTGAVVSLIRRTRSLRATAAGMRERIAADLRVLERESAAASGLLANRSQPLDGGYTERRVGTRPS